MTAELRKFCLEAGLIHPDPTFPTSTTNAPVQRPPKPLPEPIKPTKPVDSMSLLFALMHSYSRPCFICGDHGIPTCGHREPNVELALIEAANRGHR